jgi:ribonucleoside-diphosphate reductase alpha chain
VAITEIDTAATTSGPVSTTQMRVKKRNGDLEVVDVSKIVRAVERCADGL